MCWKIYFWFSLINNILRRDNWILLCVQNGWVHSTLFSQLLQSFILLSLKKCIYPPENNVFKATHNESWVFIVSTNSWVWGMPVHQSSVKLNKYKHSKSLSISESVCVNKCDGRGRHPKQAGWGHLRTSTDLGTTAQRGTLLYLLYGLRNSSVRLSLAGFKETDAYTVCWNEKSVQSKQLNSPCWHEDKRKWVSDYERQTMWQTAAFLQ